MSSRTVVNHRGEEKKESPMLEVAWSPFVSPVKAAIKPLINVKKENHRLLTTIVTARPMQLIKPIPIEQTKHSREVFPDPETPLPILILHRARAL